MINLENLTSRQKKLAEARFKITSNIPNTKVKQNGEYKNYYENIYPYINNLDIYDQITMAQWALDKQLVQTLIKKINLTNQEKTKYYSMLDENEDLNDTINFNLLDSKYDFLKDDLKYFMTDLDTEERLLSLDDKSLIVFEFLYKNIDKITKNKYPYIDSFLKTLGVTPFNLLENKPKYKNLTNSLASAILKHPIKDQIIYLILYLYNSNLEYELNTFEDLINFNHLSLLKNMKDDKSKLLLSYYGIDITEAKSLTYKYDLVNLPVTPIKKEISQIQSIVKDEKTKFPHKFSPLETLTLEENIRKEYAKSLNSSFYKPQGDFEMKDGIKIYEPSTDFFMLMTALGAYQTNYQNSQNYRDLWFKNKIRYHGIPCSLIAEDSLATAQIKNIVLGFTDFNPESLLMCGYEDLSSTEKTKKFNPLTTKNNRFMTPSILIDNTRSFHNEIVFDREDRQNKTKVSPSYLIYFEEFENINDYYIEYQNDIDKFLSLQKIEETEKNHYQETIKAAKQFNIPVVKINREKWAKKEQKLIFEFLDFFDSNHDPNLIPYIITKFENNYFGNLTHPIIREKYFSSKLINKIIKNMLKTIYNEIDDDFKLELLKSLKKAINKETFETNKLCPFDISSLNAYIVRAEEEITSLNTKKSFNI